MDQQQLEQVICNVIKEIQDKPAAAPSNSEVSLAPGALPPLSQIPVPTPRESGPYSIEVLDKTYTFRDLKQLLGYADISKSGDRVSGLDAPDEVTREAARGALSNLRMQHLYDHPLTNAQGKIDSVMRVNYQIDLAAFGCAAPARRCTASAPP